MKEVPDIRPFNDPVLMAEIRDRQGWMAQSSNRSIVYIPGTVRHADAWYELSF